MDLKKALDRRMDSNAYRRASLFVLLTNIIRVFKRRMRKFEERRPFMVLWLECKNDDKRSFEGCMM